MKAKDIRFNLFKNTAAATIATSSIANPTVITTVADHGLATGDTVVIAAHITAVPLASVNAEHVVTVTGVKTFTIPVNVTTGGVDGTATPLVAPGRQNMVSTIAADFDVVGPAGQKNLWINRVLFEIIDGSMTMNKFGGLSALTTGCKVTVVDHEGKEQADFLDGTTIKSNSDFELLAGIDALVEPAAGDDELDVRWSLFKGLGEPLELPTNWRLRFSVQDNLAGLTTFRAMAQGHLA